MVLPFLIMRADASSIIFSTYSKCIKILKTKKHMKNMPKNSNGWLGPYTNETVVSDKQEYVKRIKKSSPST